MNRGATESISFFDLDMTISRSKNERLSSEELNGGLHFGYFDSIVATLANGFTTPPDFNNSLLLSSCFK